MALTDENMVMPVSPMYGGAGNNAFGGDWAWIILLLLLGWGGNGYGYGGAGFNNALSYDFPWLMNGQQAINDNTNNGFQNAMLNDSITSVRDGINGISTQLCNGFAGVEANASARQIADLQQAFNAQTAVTSAINGVQSSLANCCCENRLATANLGALVQSENCADREALSNGIRDIITNQTANTQKILDTMCQDKIDAKNDTIAQLRSELLYARGQASQDVQTAVIQAGQRGLANEVEQYVAPRAVPAYVVQNPNCCTNYACGCGA